MEENVEQLEHSIHISTNDAMFSKKLSTIKANLISRQKSYTKHEDVIKKFVSDALAVLYKKKKYDKNDVSIMPDLQAYTQIFPNDEEAASFLSHTYCIHNIHTSLMSAMASQSKWRQQMLSYIYIENIRV